MRRETAFRILTENRRAASLARDTHAVFSVKKNGERYAKPTTTHRSAEEAETKAVYLRSVNPGKSFEVAAL